MQDMYIYIYICDLRAFSGVRGLIRLARAKGRRQSGAPEVWRGNKDNCTARQQACPCLAQNFW